MGHFVEVVVDDFAEVDQRILLNLNFSLFVNFYAGSVHNSKISDEILAVLADNHQLAFPELLVVGNLVVVGLALANLEDSLSSVNGDAKILEFFSVNSLKGHMQFVLRGLIWERLKTAALKVTLHIELCLRKFFQLAG